MCGVLSTFHPRGYLLAGDWSTVVWDGAGEYSTGFSQWSSTCTSTSFLCQCKSLDIPRGGLEVEVARVLQ